MEGRSFEGKRKCLLLLLAASFILILTTVPSGSDASVTGDLNGDGAVDDSDAIYLLYSTFYPEEYPLDQPADFNRDGSVDSEDSLYLSCHVDDPQSFPLEHPFRITYEADGVTIPESAPSAFFPGDRLELPQLVREGYAFIGWSLDPDGELFDGDTSDLTDDVTLYACWEDTQVGRCISYSVTGRYTGGSDRYTISGEMTRTFLRYSPDTDIYLVRSDENVTYNHQSSDPQTVSTSDVRWDPGTSAMNRLGKERIDTIDGPVECDRYRTIHGDGTIETHWVSGWITYKITITQKTGLIHTTNLEIVYTCSSYGFTEVDLGARITVVEGFGVTVDCGREYILGDLVTLHADVDDGLGFDAWYDADGTVLSLSPDYEFVLLGDTVLFAMNSGSEDVTVGSDESVCLNIEGELGPAEYVITNTDTEETAVTSSQYHVFEDGGRYVVSGTSSDGDRRIYVIKVTGDADRTFSWEYEGDLYSLTIGVDYDELLYARNYYSPEERWQDTTRVRDRSYVTLGRTDEAMAPFMEELTDSLLSALEERHPDYTRDQMLLYLLRFVQYLEYQMDQDSKGAEEYWRFPIETLYDGVGDCEDKVILFCALADMCRERLGMDYGIAMIILPTHMAAAVRLDGSGWMYCETTGTDFDIGEMPAAVSHYMSNGRYHEYVEIP